MYCLNHLFHDVFSLRTLEVTDASLPVCQSAGHHSDVGIVPLLWQCRTSSRPAVQTPPVCIVFETPKTPGVWPRGRWNLCIKFSRRCQFGLHGYHYTPYCFHRQRGRQVWSCVHQVNEEPMSCEAIIAHDGPIVMSLGRQSIWLDPRRRVIHHTSCQ